MNRDDYYIIRSKHKDNTNSHWGIGQRGSWEPLNSCGFKSFKSEESARAYMTLYYESITQYDIIKGK